MKKLFSFLLALSLCFSLAAPALAAEEEAAQQPPATEGCSPWAAEDIAAALELGFVPDGIQGDYTKPITREEFTYMALNFCAMQCRSSESMFFGLAWQYTLEPFRWFADSQSISIAHARQIKLINGVDDDHFEPERSINRAEAATLLLNAYRVYTGDMYREDSTLLAGAPALTYSDADAVAGWAQPPAALLAQWGVMNGVGNNAFDATGLYTREQAIVTFMRMWRQAPISRGNAQGEIPAPFTYEDSLEVARNGQALFSDSYTIENDFCGVVVGQLGGLPSAASQPVPYITIVYRSGGVYPLDGLETSLSLFNECNRDYWFPLRREQLSFGEDPHLLYITGVRRDTWAAVVMTLDLDAGAIISITEVPAPADQGEGAGGQ